MNVDAVSSKLLWQGEKDVELANVKLAVDNWSAKLYNLVLAATSDWTTPLTSATNHINNVRLATKMLVEN